MKKRKRKVSDATKIRQLRRANREFLEKIHWNEQRLNDLRDTELRSIRNELTSLRKLLLELVVPAVTGKPVAEVAQSLIDVETFRVANLRLREELAEMKHKLMSGAQ